jgi:hypothetical protein
MTAGDVWNAVRVHSSAGYLPADRLGCRNQGVRQPRINERAETKRHHLGHRLPGRPPLSRMSTGRARSGSLLPGDSCNHPGVSPPSRETRTLAVWRSCPTLRAYTWAHCRTLVLQVGYRLLEIGSRCQGPPDCPRILGICTLIVMRTTCPVIFVTSSTPSHSHVVPYAPRKLARSAMLTSPSPYVAPLVMP